MSLNEKIKTKADLFLKISSEFRLGDLPTESFHPDTVNLSTLANKNPKRAIKVLKKIDIEAIDMLKEKSTEIEIMHDRIKKTLSSGGRIFLCGCGSTGRLSLALETFWRKSFENNKKPKSEKVISFMAGGDTALIKAIENFEDHPEYAARQLRELGFKSGDLLVACSEGGETPFVIGALWEAKKISRRKPYFLYCNPDSLLTQKIKRSREVIKDKGIKKINIPIPPMALSGSTRMQASTVLMLAIGLALLGWRKKVDIYKEISEIIKVIESISFDFLETFIVEESGIYKKGDYVLYETDEYGITLLTDTSERAPTFSLFPYENKFDSPIKPSLSYICVPFAKTNLDAWKIILKRNPRVLNWQSFNFTSEKYLNGFDFSENAFSFRKKNIGDKNLFVFSIRKNNGKMHFYLNENVYDLEINKYSPLLEQVILKLIMNIHSTLIMGRLGRYENNVMTWVRPNNNKLIDRSIRYVMELLLRKSFSCTYEEVTYKLFEEMENLKEDESIVLKTVDSILKGKK